MPKPKAFRHNTATPLVMCKKITVSRLVCVGLFFGISFLVTCTGREAVQSAISLASDSVPRNPYFLPHESGLLYGVLPLVVMSSLVSFYAPGVLIVLAIGKCARLTEHFIYGFGASLITYILVTSVVALSGQAHVGANAFVASHFFAACLAWSILAIRVIRGHDVAWPLASQRCWRRLIWLGVIPLVALLFLTPVFLWQDMHDDGFEALELGRSLSWHVPARFPIPPGGIAPITVGMLPMAYPVHWFVTLFGAVEFAARSPFLLYLPVLFCVLIELIELDSGPMLDGCHEALVVLATAIVTVTMIYNASYDPYFADIASPAGLETLTLTSVLATIYFLWRGPGLAFFSSAILCYFCRPTGLLILLLLGISVAISVGHRRSPLLKKLAGAVAAVIAITYIYNNIYIPLMTSGVQSGGIPFEGLLKRYQYLRLDDWKRFNYLLFPCGILPAVSLIAYKWHDPLTRVITLTTFMYFFLFYVPAFVALHHFVPVMVLPVVVFWRIYLRKRHQFPKGTLAMTLGLGVLSLWLSLPRHFELNRTLRGIGQRIELRMGTYDSDYPTLASRYELFFELFPPDWEVEDANVELVTGPGSIIYYSTRPKPQDARVDYVLQRINDPAPTGFARVASDDVASLFVRDEATWKRDRHRAQRTDFRSRLYAMPRSILFRHWGIRRGEYTINLLDLLPRQVGDYVRKRYEE